MNNIFSKEYKENKKARKAKWKEYKREVKFEQKVAGKLLRERLKEEYADAPRLTRFYHVNANRIRKTVLTIVAIIAAVIIIPPVFGDSFWEAVNNGFQKHMDKVNSSEHDLEKIYELSPIDEEGAARIAKIPGNNADGTWTFCVYFVGSNLEDMHENDLSFYTSLITSRVANEIEAEKKAAQLEKMDRYASEIAENGLDVPEYLYKIDKPVASSWTVTEDVVVAERKGCASIDISEMCENVLPDNITIVVQTGGATRWSNALVNPNKTQRFVIKNGIMSEVQSLHIQDSCNPDTMADFIKYCADNYESDHMAMIMWDHGGGITGYGVDSIFKSGMTLADINTAFAKYLKKDIDNPYFDLIGFDACLMAATDVAVALDGYGKYLVASEEIEPGDGWDHAKWLKALADDPTLSAAALGREIADSYMDYYVWQNCDDLYAAMGGENAVTFSVCDMHKAALVDAAYEEMNEKFLKLVVDDPSVLIDMSRAAKKTMRYAESDYDYFNTIDLGTYVDYLSEIYPDECAEVRKLLKEAVLYKRNSSYLADSQGLSVYFPVETQNAYSLILLTDYVYSISDKKSTNALYFYKTAGCLNAEMQGYVADITGKNVKPLNTQMFYDYQRINPEINDNEIIINVGGDLEKAIQDVWIELASYDEFNKTITYYGTDDCCRYDGDGNIITYVDGQWFALDGALLDANYSFGTDTTSTYVAKVLHNGTPSYMTFTFDDERGDISINSVIEISDSEDVDYSATLKKNTELNPGDTIIPIFTCQDANGENTYEKQGDKVKYKVTSKIELVDLPEGDYVQSVVITDMRGDQYYSPVVEAYFKKGSASGLNVNPEFVGSN